MEIISATQFARSINEYLDLVESGKTIVIKRKNGKMYTLVLYQENKDAGNNKIASIRL
ncbi:PHD/YefM family antitoxin component YafN of YafNO toxin-antitoxin module [Parabacteroides sp. PFB2-12]|uniref:hypothetical protein n=1 Tax=unclassified Parabacteroides TaxID=2649774 RepID=UPI002473A48A|nr:MULTISPECIES: hypothetical protein [unclassified Parabacteroides]MDH6343754.1 PHD/YefM family antitoxin component YafN of YafNO toxin-antitoxin module [Parabacteroides sp. PM6-13]MDH6391916.1 PHD/YefM family antitoxin component YafN of YafNO toxin-antitoxin module [Parabacteroides sp. PFB2-12]